MPDKVPIGTHPGKATNLVDEDLILAPPEAVVYTIERLFLRRTDSTTDALVATIRNATGGGGDGLSCTIADSKESGVSSAAAITVDIGESVYLRVSSANALSLNVSGWFETEGTTGVTTALTNLARVKRFWGIGVGDFDVILNEMIASVSAEIQSWLHRKILQTTATAEKPDAPLGSDILQLKHLPIVSIDSISELGNALVEDTDFESLEGDREVGQVRRISGDAPSAWTTARRRISVTYDHGYATVPKDVEQAATELVVFDFIQSQPSQKRFMLRGTAHDAGGTGEYQSRADCWEAQIPRLASYGRM